MSEIKNREVPVLKIENLTVQYVSDGVVSEAVTHVSLEVNKGETLGLVGETGAGKTTTALACLRLIPSPPGNVKTGTVYINDRDIYSLDQKALEKVRGKEVAMIFQDPLSVLNPVHTIGAQLEESIRLHEKCSKKEAQKRAGEMLEMVGIDPERMHDYPHQFADV